MRVLVNFKRMLFKRCLHKSPILNSEKSKIVSKSNVRDCVPSVLELLSAKGAENKTRNIFVVFAGPSVVVCRRVSGKLKIIHRVPRCRFRAVERERFVIHKTRFSIFVCVFFFFFPPSLSPVEKGNIKKHFSAYESIRLRGRGRGGMFSDNLYTRARRRRRRDVYFKIFRFFVGLFSLSTSREKKTKKIATADHDIIVHGASHKF